MSFNRIIKKVPIGSIVKGGQEITVSVATQTSDWTRPEDIAVQQGPEFKKAVESSTDLVPEGTKDICQREGQHTSKDTRYHYTGVCFDESGKGKSVHFPIKD